jgi:hypothetical protein
MASVLVGDESTIIFWIPELYYFAINKEATFQRVVSYSEFILNFNLSLSSQASLQLAELWCIISSRSLLDGPDSWIYFLDKCYVFHFKSLQHIDRTEKHTPCLTLDVELKMPD